MRTTIFANDNYYHVYNRGVEKRDIFLDDRDKKRFIHDLLVRNEDSSYRQLVGIACYVLMPNHFHLLLQQKVDGGISLFMQRMGNSYTKSFNKRYDHKGRLFQGPYGVREIGSDGDLMHITRYIHRNPSVITSVLASYFWSSYQHYLGLGRNKLVEADSILAMFGGAGDYQHYVEQEAEEPDVRLLFDES